MSHLINYQYHPLRRALLYLKNSNTFSNPSLKCIIFLQHNHNHHPPPIPLRFFSTTSNRQPFTVSYLKNTCGFSQEAALKASQRIRFSTPEKPDSVIAFFIDQGFSDSQINSIMIRAAELLTCDPYERVLPKFQFLASKGASQDDIVLMVTRSPQFLLKSLQKQIVPMYELVRRFFPSDDKLIACVVAFPPFLGDGRVHQSVKLLLDEGLTESNIYHLLRSRPSVLCTSDLRKTVEEVKQLGFHPSKLNFSVALLAKRVVTRARWDSKIEAFKTWGWSEQEIFEAFKRHPQFMLRSEEKLNAVMSFWIHKLGWDPSVLHISPIIFGFSLEKRLAPRASVVKYLLSKGLMKTNASLTTPLVLPEKMFLQKFVMCFKEDDVAQLLKLYRGGCEL